MTKTKTPANIDSTIKPLIRKGKLLVLKTIAANMRSFHDREFKYPTKGFVEESNYTHSPECGRGIHGSPWGEIGHNYFNRSLDAKWIVLEVVVKSGAIQFEDKVKFRKAKIVHVGDMRSAATFLQANGADVSKIPGGTATAGDRGTATAGYSGTATAGYKGTATAGDRGTATAGDSGTATAGYRGTATAGYSGVITILYWDSKGKNYKRRIGEIGENGLKANTPYKLDDTGNLIEAVTVK